MFNAISQFKQAFVLGGLALALVAAGAVPMLGGDDVDAKKKKKPKAPNIAIQSITLEDHPDPGHNWVVVEVENVGNRNANGFRISMSAQREDGTVRNDEFSLPLSIPKGGSEEVQFRLGCNWINNGAVTVSTDPNPVPGETKTANNVLTESYGNVCS
jgi:hypothetical protein